MSLALSHREELRDYSIEVRVRNARILGLMRRAGFASVAELSRACGISPTSIGKLVNLKTIPISSVNGKYLSQVERIAEALCCHPDDMFTERQRTQFMATNRRCIEIAEAEVEAHLASLETVAPDEHVALIERDDTIQKALARLKPRERVILEARFGFDGEERNLRDIGSTLDLCGTRVSQIEARALRKLRAYLAELDPAEPKPKAFDKQAFIKHQTTLKAIQERNKALERERDERIAAYNRAANERHESYERAAASKARHDEWLKDAFQRRRAAARALSNELRATDASFRWAVLD